MGGKKKGKVKSKGEDASDDGDGANNLEEEVTPGLGKKARRKKKKFADDNDDDLTLLAGEMGLIDVSSSSALDLKDDGTSSSKVTLDDTGVAESREGTISNGLDVVEGKEGGAGVKEGKEGGTGVGERKEGRADGKDGTSVKEGRKGGASVKEGKEGGASVKEGKEGEAGVKEGKEGGAGADEEIKKKKKKKKKAEEEKKPTKGPGKAALSKIKKMQAALEEEKLRREQEALAAQRAEEEMERAREEKLKLEKERKEKLKQKEKERKQRRKLEGKPVTKKEREAEARRLAHMAALQEQGIVVPDRMEGERKKVVYGSRTRTKKDKPIEEPSLTAEEKSVMEEEGEEASETVGVSVSGEGVESWEDLDVMEKEEEEEEEEVDVAEEVDAPAPDEEDNDGEAEDECEYDSSGSSSSNEEEEDSLSTEQRVKQRIHNRRLRHERERSTDTLRSPVVCVLGHVDTGKTKILDKIRKTNVQDGEAGGITQQIGATFVPVEAIQEQTKMLKEFSKEAVSLPGLLIIDTPGHESFSNLRTRGSSMCDLAILVVDIMHGLEPQTLESLNLLRKGNTPFVVALNKIDRLFDWHRNPGAGIKDTLKRQKPNTKIQFEERVQQVCTEFAEQGLNVALFWDKVDFSEYVPLVPTSAITGDGMGDLIAQLVEFSSKSLASTLALSMEVEAIVMEVKVISGLGTTIDVILRNGVLKEGDTLVLMSSEGPFVVTVRALLMPQPLRELRVKNAYVNHSAIMAAQGIKITAKGDLEKALPGTAVLVTRRPDEVDVLKKELSFAMKNVLNSIKLNERGVYVQASTLGSLEALLEFLKQSKIPYSGISIGPVHKKDVMKASVMLEHDPQWAVILAFDVRVEREGQEMADNLGVKIFSADIIYHLFDSFLKHRAELRERNRQQYQNIAVFPCKLRILPNCIFNSRDPIVMGVVVEAGVIKKGTPLTVPSKNFTDIGIVTSLEVNHKPVEICHKGTEVCIKIESVGGDAPRLYGRHFDHTDTIVSKISRESIDAVKNYFREDLHKSDWQLMVELKKTFEIM